MILTNRKKSKWFLRLVVLGIIVSFIGTAVMSPLPGYAQSAPAMLNLPVPGVMVAPSSAFIPPVLKGIKVDLERPLHFEFLLDSGNADLTQEELKREANKLIKYFLASLTIPEDDLWVNLSPYEKDRIIPDEFGLTEMGRDLLAQDYILKQLTASLLYPEEDLGKEFWDRVYAKARQLYGTEEIPINTFNKVWILPDKAVVYVSRGSPSTRPDGLAQDDSQKTAVAFVLESHLKVMLEEDYLALKNNLDNKEMGTDQLQEQEVEELSSISSQLIKEIVIPEIEKEVNYGANFAKLRQAYHSLILAKWYKQNLKASILNREYSNQKKIAGVDVDDPDISEECAGVGTPTSKKNLECRGKTVKEKIYEQYLEAFKKGVFDYIKEDYDTTTQQVIPRKYFSGGLELRVPLEIETDPAQLAKAETTGKLSWIRGVYRQPRVSAGFVNEFIGQQFSKGYVTEGRPIKLSGGQQAEVYVVDGLLQATGQFGHIGLGAKEDREGAVVYKENGLSRHSDRILEVGTPTEQVRTSVPVVYLDSGYAENKEVRSNEKFKVEKWEEQKETLGREQGLDRPLTASEMREWIKSNIAEAAGLLKAWDSEAPSIEPLFREAEERNLLPTEEEIARTYRQPEDFRDLNLAAGPAGRSDLAQQIGEMTQEGEIKTLSAEPTIGDFIGSTKGLSFETGIFPASGGWFVVIGSDRKIFIPERELETFGPIEPGDIWAHTHPSEFPLPSPEDLTFGKSGSIGMILTNPGKGMPPMLGLFQSPDNNSETLQLLREYADELFQRISELQKSFTAGELKTSEYLQNSLRIQFEFLGKLRIPVHILSPGGEDLNLLLTEYVQKYRDSLRILDSSEDSALLANGGAGRTVTKEDLRKVPMNVLQNTSAILDKISLFIKRLKNPDAQMRQSGIRVLGLFVEEEIVNEKIIEEINLVEKLVKAFEDDNDDVFQAAATAWKKVAVKLVEQGQMNVKEITDLFGHANWRVVQAAATAWKEVAVKLVEQGKDVSVKEITDLFGHDDWRVVQTAATAWKEVAVKKKNFRVLSMEQISDYYSLLQEERKNQAKVSEDDEINGREALILKVHSIIEGKVEPDDVRYAGRLADATRDRDSLRIILDAIRGWAVDGSADAQNFLEGRVGQITSRNPRSGQDYVETNERDDVYIEVTAGSFRQRSLLPIFADRKFQPRVRVRVMKSLAESGYIDSGYAKVRESDVDRYLNLISEVYDEFNLIAPKILIENLIDQETTIDNLKAVRPRLDEIIAKRDYRVLIKGLSRNEEVMFAYYMLHQSPFQYQGTDPISYERFRKLVKASAESLDHEETDMVEMTLKNGFVAAGLDDERALQIAQAILQGRPPLPKDSPYLDGDGNFIPQKIDVLSILGDPDAPREARTSFNSSMHNIVLVLRINDLMDRIPKGIEKRFQDDEKGKTDMQKQYKWVVGGIRLGVDLNKILTELKELNDKIFPPHGRKRDLDVMVAQSVNKQIRNTPMHQDVITTMAAKKKEAQPQTGADGQTSERRIYLEDFDINGLVRNLDKMVNALKAKQKAQKLTSIERQITKEDEINARHVIRIFFANLLQRAQLGKKSPLYAIFHDLEGHLIGAFDDYVRAVSQKVDIRNVPQVVYVDFVSKFNLMEFFRFSDGAHCCLSSDPNVSSQYGAGIYEREMPRYLTNATSFWWQFTSDTRAGKQIGWFENWFGVDQKDGNKVFVGTELTYLSPSYKDRDLQTALLAQVERILFSTKVTKIAQATGEDSDHHAKNAMSPPEDYKERTMTVFRIQSLRDGEPMYADAPMATNMKATRKFHVKNNPGNIPVAAAVEADRYNVSAEFVSPSAVTEDLIERLLEIEEEVFPEHKLGGEDYMRKQLDSPNVLLAVYRDDDTREIVGYRYAVPATEAWNLPATSEYDEYRKEEVLYGADVAIQPKYWGKADMGEKFRAFFRKAKEEGYKYFAVHTESVNSVRPGASLSQKYQGMGFEVKLKEQDWGNTGDEYDFLVLDLSDSAMLGDVATSSPVQSLRHQSRDRQNPGGIDFNLDLLELEIEGQGGDINKPAGQKGLFQADRDFEHIRIEKGLIPIVTDVILVPTPASVPPNLLLILGVVDDEQRTPEMLSQRSSLGS